MRFLIILFFIQAAIAEDCFETKTKIVFRKKTIIENTVLCKKKLDNIVFFISPSCKQDQCEILNRPKKEMTISNRRFSVGSPGFKLCQELGGTPQIFEYESEKSKQWSPSSRCFFEKDFVEISLLTREWKNYLR